MPSKEPEVDLPLHRWQQSNSDFLDMAADLALLSAATADCLLMARSQPEICCYLFVDKASSCQRVDAIRMSVSRSEKAVFLETGALNERVGNSDTPMSQRNLPAGLRHGLEQSGSLPAQS